MLVGNIILQYQKIDKEPEEYIYIRNVKEKWKEEEEEQGSRKRIYRKEKAAMLNPKTLA